MGTLLTIALAVLAACGDGATATPPADPVSLFDRYLVALNAGDLEALASTYYTDDTVFSFGPIGPDGEFETQTGIAEVLAGDAAAIIDHQQITISNTIGEGDLVSGEFSLTNDELVSSGLAPVTGAFEAIVRDGKIASIKTTLDEATQQKFAAAFGPPS